MAEISASNEAVSSPPPAPPIVSGQPATAACCKAALLYFRKRGVYIEVLGTRGADCTLHARAMNKHSV